MKTYSVAFKSNKGHWITNWYQYYDPKEINWDEVKKHATDNDYIGYGYYYGHNSRNLCSKRTRTVLYEKEQ